MSRVFFKKDVMRFIDKPKEAQPSNPTKGKAPANKPSGKEKPAIAKPTGKVDWNSQLTIGCEFPKARRSILELPEMEELADSDDEIAKPNNEPDRKRKSMGPVVGIRPINTLQIAKEQPSEDSPVKENPKASEYQPTSAEKSQPTASPAKEIMPTAATTGRKPKREKKIKKHKNEPNVVRLDLKRRYTDRFRGELLNNKRMYMRNGQLKFKYRKKAAERSEMELMASSSYDIYLHSISKALYLTFDLDSDEEEAEEPKQDKEEEAYDLSVRSKPELEVLIGKIWGFKEFRFGQFETINNILNHKSTMFVSETGSGKSLTYILSAILQEGLSIVISPLISLMLDQIESIPEVLPAACITSLLNRQQKNRIIDMVKNGRVRLLYMTPEALQTDLVYHLKDFPPVNFVCVDEAHCVSELSHNFRTTYLIVNELISNHFRFKTEKTILCLTATANQQTIESVVTKMEIKELIKSTSLRPKNLCVTISRDCQDVYRSLVDYLNSEQVRKLKGVLVYCRTRKLSTEAFNFLTNSGFRVAMFHAGLEQKEKTQLLQDFRTCKIRVVVATIALGMGLDFENLDCVVHINMPKSVESYVQEIGRAGRRGKRAYTHMFLHRNDYFTERNYILAEGIEYEGIRTFLNKLQYYTRTCAREAARDKHIEEQQLKDSEEEYVVNMNLKRDPLHTEQDEEQKDLSQLCKMMQEHKKAVLKDMQKEGVICYARTKRISQELDLRTESIVTVLLKIESLSQKKLLKVLPPSHEVLKISFYSTTHDKLKGLSEFYRELTHNSRNYKGTVHVRLIDRCNDLHIDPIDAISELQKLSNTHYLKLEYDQEIILWRYIGQMTFDEFDRDLTQELLAKIQEVESNALTKLKILYTLGFLNSYRDMPTMLKSDDSKHRRIPEGGSSVSDLFDQYFTTETDAFYKELSNGEHYVPSYSLEQRDRTDIEASVEMFLNHQLESSLNERPSDILKRFASGRIITRVLLGVNTEAYNWKTYGQHSYWEHFKDRQYEEVLQQVRSCVAAFASRQEKG